MTTFKIKRLLPSVFLGLLLPFFPAGASFGAVMDPGLESALSAAAPDEEFPVIINLADRVDTGAFKEKDKKLRRQNLVAALKDKADQTQRPLVSFLKGAGARNLRSIWINNGIAATVSASALRALSARPGLESIRLDSTLNAPVVTTGTPAPAEWNLNAIHAPELWSLGLNGAGAVVAGMDTGVDVNHPDLADRWRGGTNSWFDPNGEHAAPHDVNGHGTQTMGIMVGGSYSGTAIGVAPGARWIGVKIFNDAGVAYLSSIHLGFQWTLDPDGDTYTDDAPDVVSNSWGFRNNINECLPEFQTDVQALKAADIAVVFAAGNEGPNPSTSLSPANYPEGLATGAVDETLAVAGFSGRGPSACDGSIYPVTASPGVNVRSSDLTYGGAFPDSYRVVYGTSFAASHAAGTIAVLSGALPAATVADIETAIRDTAADLDLNGPDNAYGYGLIDAYQAYNRLASVVVDSDGDGSAAAQDCNDNDPSVYPGAAETKHDGIDQDCNGYDLTIDFIKASYNSKRSLLTVEATSALNGAANLQLSGYGPMKWDSAKRKWAVSVKGVKVKPQTVTVTGVEGSESSPVQ